MILTRIKCNVAYWLLLPALAMVSCEDTEKPEPVATVVAASSFSGMLVASDTTYQLTNQAHGSAVFTVEDSTVIMVIELTNFPPNTVHAIHIHEGNCEQPKMHWNAGKGIMDRYCNELSLGIPWAKPMAGDVGNVSVGYDGSGSFQLKTDLWSIGDGTSTDIAGKVIVIHENYQDFTAECDPNHGHTHGHANQKVACGMIELTTLKE